MNDASIAHTRWNCQYHIVFIPKYRKKVIFNGVRKDLGQILRKLCEMKGVTIIAAATQSDHVHMLVSIPPKLSVSEFMGYLKGKSTLMLYDRHPELVQKGMRRNFWARGYYVSTVGNVNEETVRAYTVRSGRNRRTRVHRRLAAGDQTELAAGALDQRHERRAHRI